MKKLLKLATLFALACGAGWLSAQTLSVYPSVVSAPVGSYQTISAPIVGVNNKTVTWSTDGGTLVGTNPCTVNETCTIALYSASTGTFHVTATSNANGAVTAVATVTFRPSPVRATGHPRLYTTLAALPALQAKAVNTNPNWVDIYTQAQAAFTHYNAAYSWGSGGTCGGTHTPTFVEDYSENGAWAFAKAAEKFPSDPSYDWKCYAKDVFVNMIHQYQIVDGGIPGGANEWSNSAEPLAFLPDTMLGLGILSPTEVSNTRSFMYWMMSNQVIPSGSGFIAPHPDSGYNSPTQWTQPGGDVIYSGVRDMGNNYTMSKMLYLAAYGLTFDDNNTDDPPTTNTCSATRHQVCSDFTAGSLSAYFYTLYAGSYGYMMYAHLEDPWVSRSAFNTAFGSMPTQPQCESTDTLLHNCLGDGRGGESSEGSGYAYSMYRFRLALNAIHNAGADDPVSLGPQMSLGTSSWWDLKWISDAEFLAAFPAQTGAPRYGYLATGDIADYTRQVYDMETEAAMYLGDSYSNYTGYSSRENGLLWLLLNSAWGGPLGTAGGCTSNCGWHNNEQNGNISQYVAYEMFEALGTSDPVSSLPSDPRPSLPLDLYNGSFNQHQMARNSWTSNPALFTFWAPNTYINHEHQLAGRFDVFSNNEYITKGRDVFDNNSYNYFMTTSQYQNTLDIVNSVSTSCSKSLVYDWYPSCNFGGEFWQGAEAGQTTLLHSELPAYAADVLDMTVDYNGAAALPYWASYNDVTKAARSVIYLRGTNEVVTYDRAAVGHSASVQSTGLIATGAPTISGGQASWLTRSGTQKAYYTPLLPSGATLATAPLPIYAYPSSSIGTLHIGSTVQAVCNVKMADGSTVDKAGAPEVEWWTDNTSILTVSGTGLITAIAAGTTNVTCKYMRFPGTGSMSATTGSSSGTMTGTPADTFWQTTDWEPYQALKVTPSGTPTSSQFLTVLEWGASGFSTTTPSLVQSSAGQGFDGALVHDGGILTMFMRNWPASFTGTTFPASGATRHYISDLTPNTTYTISASGGPATATSDTAGVMTFGSDGTGNVSISTGGLPTAAPPTFSPVAGSYVGSQAVSLSTTSPGAIKCFNFTGSPSTNGGTGCGVGSTLYSGPITVSSSSTLYAVAGGTGYLDSPVGSAAYVITLPAAATPTCTPPAGTYSSSQTVTCSSTTPASTTYCTIDGSTPNTSSPVCTGITVASSLTLKAISAASGFTNSSILTQGYTITLPVTPAVTINGASSISGTITIQ